MRKTKAKKQSSALTAGKIRSINPMVEVSDEIIAKGKRKNSRHCPIAEAVQELFPNAKRISVDLQTIRWTDPKKGLRYTFLTPRAAQDFLVRFDRGEALPAFKMHLRGAHITTMMTSGMVKVRGKAKRKKVAVHKLGKRRIRALVNDKTRGTVPGQVGGKGAPLDKKHPSHSSRREYGMRAYTLDDLLPEAKTSRAA
jgi:hypothetical protein